MKKYEKSMERLEEIVRKLEGGKLGLDESMKLFSEGVAISGECSKMLDDAKLELEVLGGDGGELELAEHGNVAADDERDIEEIIGN